MTAIPFLYSMPTRIIHGPGSLGRLGEEAGFLGLRRVLLVSDPGVRKAGLVERAQQPLQQAGIAASLFTEVEENPCMATVQRGYDLLRAERLEGVIVIGGGSAMCAAKAIALLGSNGGQISDYDGVGKYAAAPLPVIAMPTTAGSGSEVSQSFILTNEVRDDKFTVSGPTNFPRTAILDAELLLSVPPRVAVFAGLDALSHAVEALWAKGATPITEALALAAIRAIFANLKRASFSPDLAAKDAMIVASAMANMACGNSGLAIVHAMGRFIESRYHYPHGQVNGVLLPIGMDFNRPVCARQFSALVRSLSTGAGDGAEAAERLADRAAGLVRDLMRANDFALTFDIRPPAAELRQMAEATERYPMTARNARTVTAADAEAMLRAAFGM